MLALVGEREGRADTLPREALGGAESQAEGGDPVAQHLCVPGAVLGTFQDFYLLNHTTSCLGKQFTGK